MSQSYADSWEVFIKLGSAGYSMDKPLTYEIL